MDSAINNHAAESANLQLRLVSDLHLFSRRSRAGDYLPAIHRAADEADLFVLAGDIFDYKWAHQPCSESFAEQARSGSIAQH